MSDEQPVRIEMTAPGGSRHMVLDRDRAAFEEQGWTYAGPEGGRVPKFARAAAETVPAMKKRGKQAAADEPNPTTTELP
jgi:hypothetical protein